jgi:NAD(P)-dependent dehydrogenase (short-subunit alcohol dehydrogenase family)
VVGPDSPVGPGIVEALSAAGAWVRTLEAPLSISGRGALEENLELLAADGGGPIDVVVYAEVPALSFEAVPFEEIDDERFEVVWEQAVQATIATFQAAFTHMKRHRGGGIILIAPTIGMSGSAPGYAAYATAVEGQRLLMKAAARGWGAHGVKVNCVAPAPQLYGVPAPKTVLPNPALGTHGEVASDLGPVVVFLASAGGHFVTGETISVDGGVWMGP